MTKPWATLYRSSLLVASFTLATCGQEPLAPKLRLAAPLNHWLDVRYSGPANMPSPALTFWETDGLTLGAKDDNALAALRQYNEHSGLVMVRVPADSDFAARLTDDPRILGLLPAPHGKTLFAIVPGNDEDWLRTVATAAHSAGGQACGRLERLSLRATAATTNITPPLYLETAHLDAVAQLVSQTSATKIGTTIATLEGMGTRFHSSSAGLTVPAKVKELFEAAAAAGGQTMPGFSVRLVDHDYTAQQSVVVTITGTEDPDTTVVLGAHLDSIVTHGPAEGPAPGADDDASGVATLVEILRILAKNSTQFRRNIELHAYAAEEVGLVGSQQIANSYQDAGRKIAAMLQLDMTAYATDKAQTIYLVTNDTSATLRRSAKDLLNTYLEGNFAEKTLSAGTSDHRSWSRSGYPAVFPFEDPDGYNHALHTTDDTSSTINNLPMAARFGSLALAFVAHHAGLVAARTEYEAVAAGIGDGLSKDLQLAFVQADDAATTDPVTTIVATDESVKRVELCATATAGSTVCQDARIQTAFDHTAQGRSFFVADTSESVVAGAHLAIFGYDANDKIMAQRTVRLEAK